MQKRGIGAAALMALVGAGVSAHALAPESAETATVRTHPTGYEAEDHFPGAALYEAVDDQAAVAAGATGTTALPDLPVPENAVIDTSIRPAQPFHLAGTALDKARALQCLTTAIYYEAASEPDDGQRAVAQVILNRVRHPAFPASVCGVVFQGSERRGCQFSFACDGALARGTPSRAAWIRAAGVAAAALGGSVFAPVGLATHYHTYAVTPAWNRSLVMTGMFGAHLFHRWKGWWGTAAAFSQAYHGAEPFPGPHTPVEPLAPALPGAPLAQPVMAKAIVPPTPREAVQPAYAESGAPVATSEATLPDSQILDKWKDSGKPLR
jgi:spore germination cell wall hydrolase CwlJ-like protein